MNAAFIALVALNEMKSLWLWFYVVPVEKYSVKINGEKHLTVSARLCL